MIPLKTYNPADVLLVVNAIPIQGFADQMIQLSRAVDTFSMDVGGQGDVVRIRSQNRTGRLVVTLLATSPTNTLLAAMAAADEATGEGVGAMALTYVAGPTLAAIGENCWIVKPADINLTANPEHRVWTFDIADLTTFPGGGE